MDPLHSHYYAMYKMKIPFNKPFITGKELPYVSQAFSSGHHSGDGSFTKKCHAWLELKTGADKALLVHSCTAALEIAAILADLQPGDEVIMPSYTFVSTANAFVLRGAIPVFVDIRSDTMNIDESLIEAAITSKTRAIVPVHYAGVACEMDTIMKIAQKHNLLVIEDAAQGVMSYYKGRPLGSIGDMGCYSFHESKNIISGEGGALLINNPKFVTRAEIIREKGTNRSLFFRGQVDKYTWIDQGSSYLPSEVTAAFLYAQLESAEEITRHRLLVWNRYHEALADTEAQGLITRMFVPSECKHNAHMYYFLLSDLEQRTNFIQQLKEKNVNSTFHYIPLHSAPAGLKFSRVHGDLIKTNNLSDRLVRLPLWVGLDDQLDEVIALIKSIVSTN